MLVAVIMINDKNTIGNRDHTIHIPHFIGGENGAKLWAYLSFLKILLILLKGSRICHPEINSLAQGLFLADYLRNSRHREISESRVEVPWHSKRCFLRMEGGAGILLAASQIPPHLSA